jgi:hypothetical protein
MKCISEGLVIGSAILTSCPPIYKRDPITGSQFQSLNEELGWYASNHLPIMLNCSFTV